MEWTGIGVTLALTTLLIQFRLSKNGNSSFNLSDFCVVMAWISFCVYGSLDTVLYSLGNMDGTTTEDNYTKVGKITYVQTMLWLNAPYFVKFAMLSHYMSFIPGYMRKTRVALWIIMVITVLSWISQLLGNALYCLPTYRIWYIYWDIYYYMNYD